MKRLLVLLLLLSVACVAPTQPELFSAGGGGKGNSDKKPPKTPPPSGGYAPFSGALPLTNWTVTDEQVRMLPLATPTFAFPVYPKTRNYLYKTQALALTATQTLVLDFTITAAPGTVFDANDGIPSPAPMPPMVTPFLWHGDSLGTITDRYWAFNFKQVIGVGGTFHVEVPLTWPHWFDVYGGQNAAQFEAARTRIDHLGVTLGGGSTYGHGIGLAGGAATLVVTGVRVQ